jgi:predicted PurR-regulated permease PerM
LDVLQEARRRLTVTMSQTRLVRVTLTLAIIALAMHIAAQLWQLGAALGNIVSIVAVSWLLSLIVRPLITYLRSELIPPFAIRYIKRKYGDGAARRAGQVRLPLIVAVALVYTAVLLLLVGGISFATASILPQTIDLLGRLPELSAQLPNTLLSYWQSIAGRLGLDPNAIDINQFVSLRDLSTQLAEVAGTIAGQAVNIAAVAAGAIGQIFLVLILSLYFVVEDRLIERQLFVILPVRFHEYARMISKGIDRAFNGYLRSQVVSALLHGTSAIVVFALFGVNFGIVIGILFAVLSVIPLVGIPIALIIAAIAALVSQPTATVPVILILLIIDQFIGYYVVPKLMSNSTGVPGLVALLAIIVGVQLLGFWGLVFSVPIVGSIYAIVFDIVLPRRRRASGLPEVDPELAELSKRSPPNIKLPALPVDNDKKVGV